MENVVNMVNYIIAAFLQCQEITHSSELLAGRLPFLRRC